VSPTRRPTGGQASRNSPHASTFAEPNTFDATVDFGAMRLGLGRSFVDGGDTEESAPVYKQWLQLEQRTFLIESAAFSELAPLMEQLSISATDAGVAFSKSNYVI